MCTILFASLTRSDGVPCFEMSDSAVPKIARRGGHRSAVGGTMSTDAPSAASPTALPAAANANALAGTKERCIA
jgi:hypothetical protein